MSLEWYKDRFMVVIGEPLVWQSFFFVLKLSNNCKRPPLSTNITNMCLREAWGGVSVSVVLLDPCSRTSRFQIFYY